MLPTRLAVGLEPLNALDAAHRSPRFVRNSPAGVGSPVEPATHRFIKRNKELSETSNQEFPASSKSACGIYVFIRKTIVCQNLNGGHGPPLQHAKQTESVAALYERRSPIIVDRNCYGRPASLVISSHRREDIACRIVKLPSPASRCGRGRAVSRRR